MPDSYWKRDGRGSYLRGSTTEGEGGSFIEAAVQRHVTLKDEDRVSQRVRWSQMIRTDCQSLFEGKLDQFRKKKKRLRPTRVKQ